MSRKRIRLALFIGSLGGGGAQRHVSLLAPRLDRSRFDVLVLCRERRGEYLRELEDAGIEVVEIASRGPLYGPSSLRAVVRLARLVRERRIDVLHSLLFECNVQAILATRLSRGTLVVAGLRNMDDKYSSLRMSLYVAVLRLADRIVAVSDPVKERFAERGVPSERIEVVENGIELESPRGGASLETAEQALGGRLPGRPIVVTLASLHPRKGLDHLLRAAKQVVTAFPGTHFLICGEGPERARLESLRAELGLQSVVLLPGAVRAVREVLASSDLFVLSSLEEGMSNALLEAHAEGIPAVVTDVGANSRVVEHGVTGLVVPPASPEALANAIRSILAAPDTRRRMGAAARERIGAHFTLDAMVHRMEAAYESVAR
ncbi:MAG TPA: glycosyltransferase [Candidatus Polarisedimenticolaceae bacterium]